MSSPTATLAPGTIVGMRYRIRALLGQGGMGHVYRAEHLGMRKEVALKVLSRERLVEGNDLEGRFEREARAMAQLDHPGCVRIFDHGRTVERQLFIAMELLDGPTLAAILREERQLATGRAVRLAAEMLRALAHAHRAKLLHRDVKPENMVFAGRDGAQRLVLIDFGLARLRDDGPLTAAGVCLGSPSYLAPERLLGRAYDSRADVYAVGVILYEMLAGIRPFWGFSPEEIVRAHLERPARPLRAARPDVSAPLDAVVVKALAKDPRRRFADAEEMLSALAGVPTEERHLAVRAEGARAEEASTTALAEIAPWRPSLPRRVWGWLRYGGWRWSSQART